MKLEGKEIRLTRLNGGNDLLVKIADSILKSLSQTDLFEDNENMDLAILSTVSSTIHILTMEGFIKEDKLIDSKNSVDTPEERKR